MRHVGGEELGLEILKDHPDDGRHVAYPRAVDTASVDPHRALEIAVFEAGDYRVEALDQGRFAGPRGAHDTDHLAGALRKRNARQCRAIRGSIREGHLLQRYRGGGLRRRAGGLRTVARIQRGFHISPNPSVASISNGVTTIPIERS